MAEFDTELRADIPSHLVDVVPGEPLTVTVPILDADTGAPTPVADADAWAVLAQVRPDERSDVLLAEFSTEASPATATVTEGAAGTVVLTATAAATATWQTTWLKHVSSPPRAICDVRVTDNTGTPSYINRITFQLRPRTTRED